MPDDRYNFENRLHQLVWDYSGLQTYWAEFETFTGLSDDFANRFDREFLHKYLEITSSGNYVSGILASDNEASSIDSSSTFIDSTTITIDATL